MAELHALGLAILAFDWRGQGESTRLVPGDLGHVDDVGQYCADLRAVASAAPALLPGNRPWFALGHSMGRLVLMLALARRALPLPLAGAILTAPFVGFALALRRPILALAHLHVAQGRRYRPALGQRSWGPHRLAPSRMRRLTFDPDLFHDDGRWIARCPELAVGGVSWGWLAALDRAHRELPTARLDALSVPVLALLAGRERLVANAAARRVLARIPGAEVALLAEARHEILRERPEVRAEALSRIQSFLARTAG